MAGNSNTAVLPVSADGNGSDRGDRNDRELPATVVRLATLVRKAREKRGWSQLVLAETAHVQEDVIFRLENGRADPPFSLAADLVRILGISLEHVVFKSERVARQIREAEAEAGADVGVEAGAEGAYDDP